MTLVIFTLAFNACPFIERQLPIFEQLKTDWRWIVVHGPSQNGGSTAWCQKQSAGLSADGTTEYLHAIRHHDRVTLLEKKSWPSKDQMCNAALEKITEPCALMQIDADEFYRPDQLEKVVSLFAERPQLSSIMFQCRYFVGPNLILQGENCYGDQSYEWLRAWRYEPGRRFTSHEPPVLEGDDPARRMNKPESRALGLVFEHYAYVLESQVSAKENFYGYPGAVNQWRALQQCDKFPVSLNRFFPWVNRDTAKVVRVNDSKKQS